MHRFTVLRDTREKKPYDFQNYPVQTKDKKLTTGDYCLERDATEMPKGGYEPSYAVERKNPSDFVNSITWERDRFENELARADSMPHRMPVVVERSKQYFEDGHYYRNVNPSSILGTIDAHPQRYNIDYFFSPNRNDAEYTTFEFLDWRRKQLVE
jgi:hypothetical protein